MSYETQVVDVRARKRANCMYHNLVVAGRSLARVTLITIKVCSWGMLGDEAFKGQREAIDAGGNVYHLMPPSHQNRHPLPFQHLGQQEPSQLTSVLRKQRLCIVVTIKYLSAQFYACHTQQKHPVYAELRGRPRLR